MRIPVKAVTDSDWISASDPDAIPVIIRAK